MTNTANLATASARRMAVRSPAPRALALTLTTLTLIAALLPLAGCGGTSGGAPVPMTIALSYIHDIQFAPLYAAAELGYYKDAGLSVTFQPNETGFQNVAVGREDAVFAGGDEMLVARSKGTPVVDVATVYRKYPTVLIVPASSSIQTVANLRGHAIGTPFKSGTSYYMLLALLRTAGLAPTDVTIQETGFQQVPALLAHKVDAITGYINNEPLQLQQAGMPTRTFALDAAQPVVSNGLIVSQTLLQQHPDRVKALVAATLRGVQYTIDHPEDAVTLAKKYVVDLDDPAKAAFALSVLQATTPLFAANGLQPGYNDPATWQSMATFLRAQGQLGGAVDVTQAYSNAYLPT
jgi:NitT/TauT family transport system substrate-binding protein